MAQDKMREQFCTKKARSKQSSVTSLNTDPSCLFKKRQKYSNFRLPDDAISNHIGLKPNISPHLRSSKITIIQEALLTISWNLVKMWACNTNFAIRIPRFWVQLFLGKPIYDYFLWKCVKTMGKKSQYSISIVRFGTKKIFWCFQGVDKRCIGNK